MIILAWHSTIIHKRRLLPTLDKLEKFSYIVDFTKQAHRYPTLLDQPYQMKNCVFCDKPLGKHRAKEHVFRNSWLKKLGHSKTPIPMDFSNGAGILTQRVPVADQLQAGEICVHCNGGWMNTLDTTVEDVILDLAQSKKVEARPGLDRDLSLWVFKTAFAFSVTDMPARRHVPKAMMHALKDGILPSSHITFFHHIRDNDHHIAASLPDIWPAYSKDIRTMDQSTRFKFAVQYNDIIIGCAYATWPNPTFVTRSAFHTIIQVHGASHRFDNNYNIPTFADAMADTRLNRVTALLGVE